MVKKPYLIQTLRLTLTFSDKSQPTFIEVLIFTYNQLHDVAML